MTSFANSLPPTNSNLYHYAGNSPVKYTDPDGRNDKTAYDEMKNNLYILQIKVNLPGKDPTTNTLSSSKVEQNNDGKLSVDGGHAFVTLIHIDKTTLEIEKNTFGLYPAAKDGIIKGSTVAGKIADDSNSYFDNSFSFTITKEGYNRALEYANYKKKNPPSYNLYINNCVDFCVDIADKAEVDLPDLPIGSSPSNFNKVLMLFTVLWSDNE